MEYIEHVQLVSEQRDVNLPDWWQEDGEDDLEHFGTTHSEAGALQERLVCA